jgi:hypothetical protein
VQLPERGILERVLGVILLVGGLGGGLWLAQSGFGAVQDLRALERLPVSGRVGAVLPGEVALRAPARPVGVTLRSPRSGTPSLYYRYRHEVRTRDSEGRERWSTRTDRAEAVDFVVADESGRLRVPAQRDFHALEVNARQRLREVVGSQRYTEWRIEPGDSVLVVGRVRARPTGTEFVFREGATVPSLLSGRDAASEREAAGGSGVLRLWGGLALLSVGVLGGVLLLQVHRVLAFLAVLTLLQSVVVLEMGLRMLHGDLVAGVESVQVREAAARARIDDALSRIGEDFPGWERLPSLDDPRYAELSPGVRAALTEMRFDVHLAHERVATRLDRFPDGLVAAALGLELPDAAPPIPPGERAAFEARADRYEPTRLEGALPWTGVVLGLVLALLASWWGLRAIRLKRTIENLPTSKAAGASCGLVELSGTIRVPEAGDVLSAPVTGLDCLWYHYEVEERRGSGKRRRWVTVEERTECAPLLCEDDSGALVVEPEGAEVISRHRDVRRSGDRRYTERTLRPGDPCYALGPAAVCGEAGDRLGLAAGDDGDPFLLANRPERTVMLRKALTGMGLLDVAFTALLLALLLAFAASGSFSPADFLLAALVGPAWTALVMLVLHYNDLLFLRERARRNWANVQVSLRKRSNLLRPLQKIVTGYLAHERDLQTRLAEMRTRLRTATDDPQAAARYLEAEASLDAAFRVVVENHPKLKGAKVVRALTEALTRLENEIALMRAGYNDAVETYNARIATFPDVLLARPLRFERLSWFAVDTRAATPPSVDAAAVSG